MQSSNRNATVSTSNPSSPAADETSTKSDQLKASNIPPRGSSADGVKRTLSPSPLSKPATMANEPAGDATPAAAATTAATSSQGKTVASPAAKQLAAINEKDVKGKTKTSRLRRAFSFGSAAEFRKAAGPDGEGMERVEASKLRKDPTADEAYDAEQARIAEAQEAAGIGNNIYGGRFFGGSTDNLSISSTASSASIMIRKMGRGMKKSTRSLVGLFRPKSANGMPAADTPVSEAGQAAVSMITVEAETRRVNVTADPQGGKGGTGFPRLERNSLDATQIPEGGAERAGSSGADNGPRKSIVGGEKERAEVLAAVRKGILKRMCHVHDLYLSLLRGLLTDKQVQALQAHPFAHRSLPIWSCQTYPLSPTRPTQARLVRRMTTARDPTRLLLAMKTTSCRLCGSERADRELLKPAPRGMPHSRRASSSTTLGPARSTIAAVKLPPATASPRCLLSRSRKS